MEPAAIATTMAAAVAPVVVAEVAAESLSDDGPEIPWHITPAPGRIAMQLRSTVRRVAVGAGLARRPELLAAVRALEGVPPVVTSPAGGTFIIGGEPWLGLCAIGSPHPGQPLPLDWMLRSLLAWFERALQPYGIIPAAGRVEGAWCPGFSDIGVRGRKMIGLGFRVTRERVVMRGVMAVRPMPEADFDILSACHRLIDVDMRRGSAISLAEASGRDDAGVESTIEVMRSAET